MAKCKQEVNLMSLAHLQLLETASKVNPSVADKAGLELPFNFHFLIIKQQYMKGYKLLVFLFFISKPKDDKVMVVYEIKATAMMMQIFHIPFFYCTLQ